MYNDLSLFEVYKTMKRSDRMTYSGSPVYFPRKRKRRANKAIRRRENNG